MRQSVVNIIGLQTHAGRLLFFILASITIFFAPYDWLAHLSIWQNLGMPSPSIGLTRAYHKLLHGDFVGAWQRNKLIYVVLVAGIPLLIHDAYQLCYNRLHS